MLWKWYIDDTKMGFQDEKETKRLFKELWFCNILVERQRIKHLQKHKFTTWTSILWCTKCKANIKSI